MATNYSPRLPLAIDNDGNFINITDYLENVRQKLKMILLTSPGEKLMDPLFGIGVKNYLFENASGNMVRYNFTGEQLTSISTTKVESDIQSKLLQQTTKYAPDITIESVTARFEEQSMYLSIKYNYKNFVLDTLDLTIT